MTDIHHKEKDFLGNEYGPGDFVLYATTFGRSINMVYGKIISFTATGNVRVLPLASSRWEQHSNRSHWVDNRSGKRISNPYEDQHVAIANHYEHKVSGAKIPVEDYYRLSYYDSKDYFYVATTFKDYVQREYTGVQPVVIKIKENIVKVDERDVPADYGSH